MTLDGWTSVTVEQCCDILDSKRVPVNAENREKRIGEIPYYGANGLQGYIDDFIFDEPLILIAEDGGCFDEFAARPIAYRIKGKSWVNNHAHVLRAKKEFDQDAVFYSLEHKDIQSFIVGGTRSKLNQSALRAISFSLPSAKPEQTKIAEILSTVDRTIEQTEALIAKQQRIKTGLMQDLLTRGIDDHGNLRSEKTHKFKDSSIKGIRIPESWKDCNLRHVTKVNQGLQIPIDERFKEEGSNRYKYITVQYLNEPNRYLEFIEKPPPQLVCNSDDILFTRTGNTGQIITGVEGVYHNNFFKIAFDKQSVRKEYLIYFLNWQPIQDMIIELAGTTTIPDLNHGDFYALPLFLPETGEQKKIEVILCKQDAEIQAEILKLRKYKSLKTALMQDLLTGKKRVTALLNDREVMNV